MWKLDSDQRKFYNPAGPLTAKTQARYDAAIQRFLKKAESERKKEILDFLKTIK